MDATTKSSWRITWELAGAPLVLLDFGDSMLAEPEIGQAHTSEMVPFARALYMVGFHFDNVSHSISFSRIVDTSTHAASRNGMFNHLVATAALRVADIKIEVQNGDTFHLRSCVISEVTPVFGPDYSLSKNRVVHQYVIQGGKLTGNIGGA